METMAIAPAGEGCAAMAMKELYKVAPEEFIEAWYRHLETEGQHALVELIDRVANEQDFTTYQLVAVMIGVSFMPWPDVPHLTAQSLGGLMGTGGKSPFFQAIGVRNTIEYEIRISFLLEQHERRRVNTLLARIFRVANH